jgi:hypothetical protein
MSLAIEFMDGFEQWCNPSTALITSPSEINTLWNGGGGPAQVGSSFGRFGGIGASGGGAGGGTLLSGFAIPATFIAGIGLAYKHITAFPYGTIAFADIAGTIQVSLGVLDTGSIVVKRGSFQTGTVLGSTAAGVYGISAFHHIEFQSKVDPTTGTVDVWVDGVCVLSLNNVNTRGSSVVGSGVSACGLQYYGGSQNCHDDFIGYDATSRTGVSGAGTPASCTFEHIGDKRVQTLMPSGAGTGDVGTFTQVGGTGGQPYTAVNERPQNGDTSYVADNVAGDIKSFALDDLAAGTTGIIAVAAVACYEKDDAASRTCAVGIRTSSTNAFGTTRNAPSSYGHTQDIFTLDGAGAALTTSGVNGTEILFKVVS